MEMPNKPLRVVFTNPQFKTFIAVLNLDAKISREILFSKLDVTEFKDSSSVYHLVNYKVYDPDIESKWKQYRGIIIKDYNKIVCSGVGHTPSITLEGKLSDYLETKENGDSFLRVYETLENKLKEEHIIPLVNGKTKIRPAFQGSIVRLWLSNGIMYKSTLRNPYISTAKWMGDADEDTKEETVPDTSDPFFQRWIKEKIAPDEEFVELPDKKRNDLAKDWTNYQLTFASKFDALCDYNRDVFFQKGVENSPFCHIFIMVSPQVSSHSHIDCGEGYLMYLETKECYEPIKNDPREEETSFFFSKIPKEDLTEEEIKVGIKKQMDRFIFPLQKTKATYPMANLIPPPTTRDYLRKNSAIYTIGNGTMSFDEAENFLVKGVSVDLPEDKVEEIRRTFPYQMVYKKSDIRKLEKNFPLGLPGESLYCTCLVKGEIKTYILNPQCSLYRSSLIKDPNSRATQLTNLRSLAIAPPSNPTGNHFSGTKTDLDRMNFEDLVWAHPPSKDYYLGIDNTTTDIVPPAPTDSLYLPIKTSEAIIVYPIEELIKSRKQPDILERNSYSNSRWFIIALHYCLAMTPRRRKEAWESFRKVYKLYDETLRFISSRYEEILDMDSDLYKNRGKAFPLALTNKHRVGQRIVEIINKAKSNKYTVRTENEPDNMPDDGSKPVTIKVGRPVGRTSYAEAFGLPESESNPAMVSKNIRNLLRKEEGQSLARIMKVIKIYKRDNPSD